MDSSSLNELRQIKIQDQVRDLIDRLSKSKKARRRIIAYSIEAVMLLIMVLVINNFAFFLGLLIGEINFSYIRFDWLTVITSIIIFVGMTLIVIRIVSTTNEISQIELAIKKRQSALRKLDRG